MKKFEILFNTSNDDDEMITDYVMVDGDLIETREGTTSVLRMDDEGEWETVAWFRDCVCWRMIGDAK